MSNRCSVRPVVPGLVALASAALLSLPVLAADYMLETPGESYTMTGEMVAETESMSVTKTVRVAVAVPGFRTLGSRDRLLVGESRDGAQAKGCY